MWAFLTGGLSSLISGVLSPLFQWLNKKQDVQLDGFKTAAGIDLGAYKAALDAQVQMASIRSTAMGANRLVQIAIGLIAISIALHWMMLSLDSTFTWGTGRYGNFGVPKLPQPYDAYEWEIIKAMFYIGPALPVASAVAAWLHRK